MRPVVYRLVVALLASVLAASLLAACGGESVKSPTVPAPVPSVSLTVNVSKFGDKYISQHIDLIVGMTNPVEAWLSAPDGHRQSCGGTDAWSSSDPLIATVTPDRKAHAVGPGTATISATCFGVTGTATVTVYAEGALSGTVRDESGAPIAGATVGLDTSIWDPHIDRDPNLPTDAAGRYRIAGIATGRDYWAFILKDGYENVGTRVTLAGPETVRDFTMKAGFFLTGTVTEPGVGPVAGATVEVTSGVNAGKSSVTAYDGRYSLGYLLPGHFTLRASKAGYDAVEKTIDTSVGLTIDFALKSSYGSCLVAVNPLAIDRFASAGGTATVNVTGTPGRTWTASSDQAWIEVPAGASGTGAGQVLLQLLPAAAGATDVRSGNVRVGCGPVEGQTIRISQLPDCRITLSWMTGSPTTFPASGGSGWVKVAAGTPGCHWWYDSLNDWITRTGTSYGYGDESVAFIVRPNTTGAPRTGAILVGEKKWEITQAGQ